MSYRKRAKGCILTVALSLVAVAVPASTLPASALAAPGDGSPTAIDYPAFPDAGTLSLNGTAAIEPQSQVLRLTGGGFRQSGSAWAAQPIDLTRSFDTTFQAYLHAGANRADGIAFLVQAVGPRALGGWGGGLGYRGIRPSVAVELDDFRNVGDPAGDHVGVVLRGNPDFHLATAPTGIPLYGSPISVRISYDAPTHHLTAYVGSAEPTLSATVDLATEVGGQAWAGFTGATGSATSTQDILSWRLSSPAA